MSPHAVRALAAKWFLRGFRLSGKGFHGENYDPIKYPALTALLLTEFGRIYKVPDQDSGNGPRPTRGAPKGRKRR